MSSEMITLGLMMANVAAMAAIFVYSACSLSVKRWTAKQPDYWIHSFLVGGSIAVIGHTAGNWQLHHWTEVMFICWPGYCGVRGNGSSYQKIFDNS